VRAEDTEIIRLLRIEELGTRRDEQSGGEQY
jgi:hypothetical protein